MLLAARNGFAVKKRFTAKDYIQDGLIAMWDGIENAGWGVHDANATVWKDLVGNQSARMSNMLVTDNSMRANLNTARITMPASLVDFYVRLQPTGSISSECVIHKTGTYGTADFVWGLCRNWNVQYGIISYASGIAVYVKSSHAIGNVNYATISVIANNTQMSAYKNGVISASWSDVIDNSSINSFSIFGNAWGGTCLKGEMFNIRFYSRALTADEIAHNYSIDKARFNLP